MGANQSTGDREKQTRRWLGSQQIAVEQHQQVEDRQYRDEHISGTSQPGLPGARLPLHLQASPVAKHQKEHRWQHRNKNSGESYPHDYEQRSGKGSRPRDEATAVHSIIWL